MDNQVRLMHACCQTAAGSSAAAALSLSWSVQRAADPFDLQLPAGELPGGVRRLARAVSRARGVAGEYPPEVGAVLLLGLGVAAAEADQSLAGTVLTSRQGAEVGAHVARRAAFGESLHSSSVGVCDASGP